MAYKRNIDRLPIIPAYAKMRNVTSPTTGGDGGSMFSNRKSPFA